MKKLAGLVIILAVLVLGGYYGMGVFTESTLKKNVELVNKTNGLYADVTEYNKGLFSSDAKIEWRLHVPARSFGSSKSKTPSMEPKDYEIILPVHVYHGPVMYYQNKLHYGMGYAETSLQIPAQYSTKFDEIFTKESNKPQLEINLFVDYSGESYINSTLPPFKLIAKDGSGTFNWLGMTSQTTMTRLKNKIDGDVVIDGMDFSAVKGKVQFTFGKLTSDYHLHETSSGLFLGDAKLSLPMVSFVSENKKMFDMSNLVISSNSDVEGSLFSTHSQLSLDKVTITDKIYGPGVFEMSIRNLDADVLANINKATSDLQSASREEQQKALMAIVPEIPKLFTKGAELEISKCQLTFPEGDISATLLVVMPKGDSPNPLDLIQKMKGDANIKIPVVLLKQLVKQVLVQQMTKQPDMQDALIAQLGKNTDAVPPTQDQLAELQADKQISSLEQNSVIVLNGANYTVEVNFEQGKLYINGKPFDPSMVK